MRYLLNSIYLCLLLILSPALVYSAIRHGKYRDGWKQKLLGLVPSLDTVPNRIWFHAVSVGEVNLLDGMLCRLAELHPSSDIVISTTTKTGYGLAKRKYPDHLVFYCPLDFSWAVRNTIRRIQPTALVLVELELWPNLLCEAGRHGLPVAIVNGRLSDRSTKGYLRLGSLMRNWMSNITLVTAQSGECADRFVQIGVPKDRVYSVGSMKFDGAKTDRNNSQSRRQAELFGVSNRDVVFVAGSTQAPEEEMALSVFRRLVSPFPELRLVLVPRHPERANEVAKLLDETDVHWVRRTTLDSPLESDANTDLPRPDVILVDTVGELAGWWGCAQIGFVGGSMGSRGGQNMLEPSAFGVATCFGPNTKNFRDIVELLVKHDAVRVVYDENSLHDFVKNCLEDRPFGEELGQRAKDLVVGQRGATDQTVRLLVDELNSRAVAFLHPAADSQSKRIALPQVDEAPASTRRRA